MLTTLVASAFAGVDAARHCDCKGGRRPNNCFAANLSIVSNRRHSDDFYASVKGRRFGAGDCVAVKELTFLDSSTTTLDKFSSFRHVWCSFSSHDSLTNRTSAMLAHSQAAWRTTLHRTAQRRLRNPAVACSLPDRPSSSLKQIEAAIQRGDYTESGQFSSAAGNLYVKVSRRVGTRASEMRRLSSSHDGALCSARDNALPCM